jgi:hypothetical protein
MVAVPIAERAVWVGPWLHVLQCPTGGAVPILLLGTDVSENDPDDRGITSRLYGGDAALRLKQEIVLGIGGEMLLRALGFEIATYPLNEGHAALVPLTLLRRYPQTADSPEAEQLKGIPGYRDPFVQGLSGRAGSGHACERAESDRVFEATLITSGAPFDRYLKGESGALSPAQRAGLTLFINKGCSACHSGVNIGGGMYAPFGVVEKPGAELLPPADKGRFMVIKTPGDEYVFKVPTLRNITLTAPYFHTGQAWDLRQAVTVMGTSQLGTELTDDEVDKITAFLGSLTDEQPKGTYPILPPGGAGTPRPEP